MKPLKVLLINPYIYDVSAYGFWSSPLGLLYLGAILKRNGMQVELLDCLVENEEKRKGDGRAPFLQHAIESPEPAKGLRKRFKRYGISQSEAERAVAAMEAPDLVLVTSMMTYWYEGAAQIVTMVRDLLPGAKIVVGGVYASLCYEHAKRRMAGADLIAGRGGIAALYGFLERTFSASLAFKPGIEDFGQFPYPLFNLYRTRSFVPLLTSFGCLYNCTYCASRYLYPRRIERRVTGVVAEIQHWNRRGVRQFALYDDNFLYNREGFAKPLLRALNELPFEVSIYNPNALNASLLDRETAILLKGAGFREVRMGLEMIDPSMQRSTGGKVDRRTFEGAVAALFGAGFGPRSVRAYVLAGLPFQKCEEAEEAIDYVSGLGVEVNLAHYTPIPHTPMFEQFHSFSRYPIAEEPLFQNNALFPFAWEGFTEEDLNRLKAYAREKNGVL